MLSAQIEARDMREKYEEQVRLGRAQLNWGKLAAVLAGLAVLLTAIALALTVAWHGR